MLKQRFCLIAMAALALACGAAKADVVTGLEGYWPLDSDAQDFSGNERHGTPIGGTHFVNNGVYGGALELDGTEGYVSVDGYKGIFGPPWTLTCWIQTTASGEPEMLSWGSEGGGLKVEFRLDAGRVRIEHGDGNNRSETLVNDGLWHHVVAVLPEGGNDDLTGATVIVNVTAEVNANGGDFDQLFTASNQDTIGGVGDYTYCFVITADDGAERKNGDDDGVDISSFSEKDFEWQ